MLNRKPDNETLDKLGRSLIAAAKLSEEEIDSTVSSPQLFLKVQARTRALPAQSVPYRPMLFWMKRSIVFAAVILTTFAAVIYSYLSDEGHVSSGEIAVKQIPAALPEAARPKVPPEPVVNDGSVSRAADIEPRPVHSTVRRTRTAREARPQTIAYREPEAEFYSLTFAGDPYETARGGRVVRMDIPRSRLFSMGIDLSLENEPEFVKADVLIGADGIARAIRIIE